MYSTGTGRYYINYIILSIPDKLGQRFTPEIEPQDFDLCDADVR